MIRTSLAALALCSLVLAAPTAMAAPDPARPQTVELALAIGKGQVSDRRLRAIAPHLDAVVGALGRLADQDAAASARGAPITDEIVEAVRASSRDLMKAASFNRIPDPLLHRLLAEAAEAEFSGRVPAALQDGQGRLDAAQLLSGVVGRSTGAKTRRIDTDYLAAINGEGARTVIASAEPAAPAALTPTAAPATPPNPFDARILLAEGQRWITVQQGDTLGSIAVGVYGDSLFYQRIYTANRDVLSTPNTIAPGQKLRLPE